MKNKKISVIITAAGTGSRFGGNQPKQFMMVNKRPMLISSIIPFLKLKDSGDYSGEINEIIITVQDSFREALETIIHTYLDSDQNKSNIPIRLVIGGASRQVSVYKGIQAVSSNNNGVLIHDGARPHVSSELIARVLAEAQTSKAVIPVIPVTDTIKQVSKNIVQSHLDRDQLAAVQTPQYFELDSIRQAYESVDIHSTNLNLTDESMLMAKIGIDVNTVDGDVNNLKITYPNDLNVSPLKK